MKAKNRISNEMLLSVGILLLALAVLIIFMSEGISGNDFWWHIKVGEYICQNRIIPQTDIFSWYGISHNIEWTAHEWLGEVFLYKVFSFGGEKVIYIFCLGAAIVMNLLIWYEIRKSLTDKLICGSFFLLTMAITSSMFFYGRPQIFGFFFVYIEIKILYAFIEDACNRAVYFLPILAVLWSNIYGGSSNLCYILCFLFLGASVFEIKIGKIIGKKLDKKRLFVLFFVAVAVIVALTINPIGYNVLTYPYANLSDSISMNTISEWKAPDAKMIGNLVLFFGPIAISVLGFVHTEDEITLIDLLLWMAFVLLFLRSVRFIMLWYIVAAVTSSKYWFHGPRIRKSLSNSRGILIFFVLIGTILMTVVLNDICHKDEEKVFITKVLDTEAIDAVKKSAPQRLFNDYNLGEALIYHDIPVFFDARADLFSECGILSEGLELMSLQPISLENKGQWINAEVIIEKYKFDYILVRKDRPLYSYLYTHPTVYRVIYEDEGVGYFEVRGK